MKYIKGRRSYSMTINNNTTVLAVFISTVSLYELNFDSLFETNLISIILIFLFDI